MRFGLAFTVIVSGASASVDDVDVHVDKTLTDNHDKINAIVRALVSLSSSTNSKKGQRFVLSPFEDSKIEDTAAYSNIGPRKLHNSVVDKDDYDNKGTAVTLDDSSTSDTKAFELCNKKILGVLMPCSSKEDVSIDELNLLGDNDDTSSAATVVDDEGIHRFYLAPKHYALDTVDGESLDTKEAVEDHRQLRSDNDCKSYCKEFGRRPKIKVSGSEFRSLIDACIGVDTSSCPDEYNIPLDCWKTSKVTDMHYAFLRQYSFNEPLKCWDVSEVTDMRAMFFYANAFNRRIKSWDVSEVMDMRYMFNRADAFNQPIESWDVSKVYDMSYMFYNAYAFDQPIKSWNVAKVKDMAYMFAFANAFNQPIESWKVSKVTDMAVMFFSADSFNQCLYTWADKTGEVETRQMFENSGCPIQSVPDPNMGPWCQDIDDGCSAPDPTAAPTRSKKSKKSKKSKST